jgi:hypothetical protein
MMVSLQPTQQDSILPKKAPGFPIVSVILLIVGTSIECEHNDEILAENERIV